MLRALSSSGGPSGRRLGDHGDVANASSSLIRRSSSAARLVDGGQVVGDAGQVGDAAAATVQRGSPPLVWGAGRPIPRGATAGAVCSFAPGPCTGSVRCTVMIPLKQVPG